MLLQDIHVQLQCVELTQSAADICIIIHWGLNVIEESARCLESSSLNQCPKRNNVFVSVIYILTMSLFCSSETGFGSAVGGMFGSRNRLEEHESWGTILKIDLP